MRHRVFNVWKQHRLINYYTLAGLIASSSSIAYTLDYLPPKPLAILLGFCLGLACFAISARMMIIFTTAVVSFIALGIYYQMMAFVLLPTIFGILTAMLVGYSLTFSKGRWFVVLYLISLTLVAGIAQLLGLLLPAH
jgi:hypothetical protein